MNEEKATIFIVDDNSDLAEALSINLVAEGYHVKCFNRCA